MNSRAGSRRPTHELCMCTRANTYTRDSVDQRETTAHSSTLMRKATQERERPILNNCRTCSTENNRNRRVRSSGQTRASSLVKPWAGHTRASPLVKPGSAERQHTQTQLSLLFSGVSHLTRAFLANLEQWRGESSPTDGASHAASSSRPR